MEINAGTTRTRVAIVDDNPEVRFLLATVLELDDRFEVVGEAGDARAAVATVAATEPELILMDLDLGAESGSSLIRRLRRAGSSACVVVVTGSDDPRDHAAAFDAGANGIQNKCALTTTMVDELAGLVRGHAVPVDASPERQSPTAARPRWFTGRRQVRGAIGVPACA